MRGCIPVPRRRALLAALASLVLATGCASSLIQAVAAGDAATTRQLLESGAFDPDATDPGGRSALSVAVLHDRPDVARVLLAGGADANRLDPDGRSPLHWAAQRGLDDMVRLLVAGGASVEVRSRSGRATPLIEAAWADQTRTAGVLLAAGASPDVTEELRSTGTALHVAVLRNNVELAGLLLAYGADPTVRDGRGRSATELAERTRRRDIARLIAERSRNARPGLAYRPPAPDLPTLPSLPSLESGDARSERWSEADRRFYRALRVGDVSTVDHALWNGIDVDGWRFEGLSPLEWAIVMRQDAVVDLLLQHGADPDRLGANGRRPLHLAVQVGSREVAQTLLLSGADPDAPDGVNGASPLIEAVWRGETEIARLLIASGADLDLRERGRSGGTALHAATQAERPELVELLLAGGADPEVPDRRGRSVRAEAERLHRERALALLRVADDPSASRRPSPDEDDASRPPDSPFAAAPPRATPAPRRPASFGPAYARRVAAVIGIDRYRHWPSLEGARADAERFAATLRAQGFDEVIEVYDEEATRARILGLLGSDLAQATSREDLAVIFFAGHGYTETLPDGEKRGYVVPADASRRDAFSTAISMATLRDLSNRLPAKHVYYAMDSCYSGLGFARGIAVPARGSGYFEKVTSLRAVQMLTAGAEGEQVYERGGQGLFTTYLIRAIEGQADYDGDGAVTASEIGTYVKPQVSIASGYRQTPQFGTLEGTGEVVFLVR